MWVDDGTGPCPEWATSYEEAASGPVDEPLPWGRTGDDLIMLYTGGTTGMPKGVMWRQDDLVVRLVGNLLPGPSFPEDGTVHDLRELLTEPRRPIIPACPLMHGTGWFSALSGLSTGAAVATLPGASFDAVEFLDAVERYGAGATAIVGDAFCKPILRALDTEPDRWDISSLERVTSAGVMWSQESKEGLLRHNPNMSLRDSFASSEALGMGVSISGKGAVSGTAQFQLTPESIVIDDSGRRIEPGSDEVGRLAVGGRQPDRLLQGPPRSRPARSSRSTASATRAPVTSRWSPPMAPSPCSGAARCASTPVARRSSPKRSRRRSSGTRRSPTPSSSASPDEKFGEAVTGVVELRPGAELDERALISHVREGLAAYKSPKRILPVTSIARAPNGKVDYKRIKSEAVEALGVD